MDPATGERMEEGYEYPDVFDRVTLTLIQSRNLDTARLEEAETRILSSVVERFATRPRERLLDLGCGTGRLTLKFSGTFSEVTALEPDRLRMQHARDSIRQEGIRNVTCLEAPFLDAGFGDETFDAVLCSQVIQHIDTNRVEPMLKGIFRVLRDDGILVLTTSYSNRDEDFFLEAFVEKGEVVRREISEQEFNRLVVNKEQSLPIHYFTADTLRKSLAGFTETKMSIFTDAYPDPMLDTILFLGMRIPT